MIDALQTADPNARAAEATVADAIGEALHDLGVTRMFTLLGSGNFIAAHAFGQRGGKIVHTRHENAAVAMADGWARVSGGVGVASLHTGPGLTNAITAIAEAPRATPPSWCWPAMWRRRQVPRTSVSTSTASSNPWERAPTASCRRGRFAPMSPGPTDALRWSAARSSS